MLWPRWCSHPANPQSCWLDTVTLCWRRGVSLSLSSDAFTQHITPDPQFDIQVYARLRAVACTPVLLLTFVLKWFTLTLILNEILYFAQLKEPRGGRARRHTKPSGELDWLKKNIYIFFSFFFLSCHTGTAFYTLSGCLESTGWKVELLHWLPSIVDPISSPSFSPALYFTRCSLYSQLSNFYVFSSLDGGFQVHRGQRCVPEVLRQDAG